MQNHELRSTALRGTLPLVSWLALFSGIVALIQGVAWIDGRGSIGRRWVRLQGTILASVGLAVLATAIGTILLPGFWSVDFQRANESSSLLDRIDP